MLRNDRKPYRPYIALVTEAIATKGFEVNLVQGVHAGFCILGNGHREVENPFLIWSGRVISILTLKAECNVFFLIFLVDEKYKRVLDWYHVLKNEPYLDLFARLKRLHQSCSSLCLLTVSIVAPRPLA